MYFNQTIVQNLVDPNFLIVFWLRLLAPLLQILKITVLKYLIRTESDPFYLSGIPMLPCILGRISEKHRSLKVEFVYL